MNNFISKKTNSPPKDRPILVMGKFGIPHVVKYDCNEWNILECHYDEGRYYLGEPIEFEYWMYLPNTKEIPR